jgi:hypothetical protein
VVSGAPTVTNKSVAASIESLCIICFTSQTS